MHNPYQTLPEKNFWKTAVASKSIADIEDLWDPKFKITQKSKISTFGSCFAQHIGSALKERGFHWLATERPPASLSSENAKKYNYNVFSARTGNIYTTSLLKQWTEWALNLKPAPDEVWKENGRYYDPFRPRIEPEGFESIEEAVQSRRHAIQSFRQCIKASDIFVFTLGLTESWFNTEQGYEYPICPGAAAGEYVAARHAFKNQQFAQILQNLRQVIQIMRKAHPPLRFILTVSPVPLAATKTENNVLVATMESKSILRAVAGQLSAERQDVDYFPSYEIINSPVFKGQFFEPNQRTVTRAGVNFVMQHFFQGLERKFGVFSEASKKPEQRVAELEEVCDEEILASFR